jgi:hypothetical protein
MWQVYPSPIAPRETHRRASGPAALFKMIHAMPRSRAQGSHGSNTGGSVAERLEKGSQYDVLNGTFFLSHWTNMDIYIYGGFPKFLGLPHFIIHFTLGFSIYKSSILGIPHDYLYHVFSVAVIPTWFWRIHRVYHFSPKTWALMAA